MKKMSLWVKVDADLVKSPKIARLAKILKISRAQARGHIIALWLNTLRYQPDGDVTRFGYAGIAELAEWPGEPARAFIYALKNSVLLDIIGKNTQAKLYIHDWYDYAGPFLLARAKKSHDPARVQAVRNAIEARKQFIETLPSQDLLPEIDPIRPPEDPPNCKNDNSKFNINIGVKIRKKTKEKLKREKIIGSLTPAKADFFLQTGKDSKKFEKNHSDNNQEFQHDTPTEEPQRDERERKSKEEAVSPEKGKRGRPKKPPTPTPEVVKTKFLDAVWLTKDDLLHLRLEYGHNWRGQLDGNGDERLQYAMEKLNNYLMSRKGGDPYRSHRHVLMGWIRRAIYIDEKAGLLNYTPRKEKKNAVPWDEQPIFCEECQKFIQIKDWGAHPCQQTTGEVPQVRSAAEAAHLLAEKWRK